jgi:hypothetical protein
MVDFSLLINTMGVSDPMISSGDVFIGAWLAGVVVALKTLS